MKLHPSAPAAAGLAGLLVGLALSSSRSMGEVRDRASEIAGLPAPGALDPLRALPRTRLVVAMEDARSGLESGRPWGAWTELRDHVEDPGDAPASAVLLAARAAAGWGGWGQVRRLLDGRPWLDREGDAEGWLLLGRAREEAGQRDRAVAAYRRYVGSPDARSRGVAYARLGAALADARRHREAADAFGAAAEEIPAVRDWLRARQAEALAAARDPRAVAASAAPGSSGAVRVRQARAEASFRTAAGDTAGALDRLERESRALAVLGWGGEAAPLSVDRARLLRATGRAAEARELLRAVSADSSASADDRLLAARVLGELADTLTAAEQLARAAAFEAAGKPGLAARSIRLAIAAGAPDDPELRLRQGKLLFEEADLEPARAVLRDAAARLADPERAAEAELYAARARLRGGDRAGGLAALRAVAETRPGTAAAGAALYYLGDASANREAAISFYRRSATVGRSPEAREALFRLGDRSLRAGDPTGARRAWEEYARRYPRGPEAALAAYNAGVMHERAGRDAEARAMYDAAMAADPVSYHAVRAGERADADPLARTLREPHPWVGLPSDAVDAAGAVARLAALEAAGMEAEWAEELGSALHRFERRPLALLGVAEGLRDGGHTIEAIRLGRRLLEARGGRWDPRLLRVVFPFPFREILVDEAEDAKVDPALLAALVRQESSFDPGARSRVGARGLAQIMPSTARWLAPGAGVRDFHEPLLAVPEVNLRMGARYLRDQLRRYDGAHDLALAAYNAGPSRADRWRRELGYGRDVDRFRERIPFAETREYVQVVLRNADVYRRLYGL